MDIFERFLQLDRRIIFVLVAAAVVIPMLAPLHLRVTSSPPVERLYSYIDRLKAGTPVIISMDYDPGTQAELTPMAEALVRHCWRKHLPVIIMSLDPGGAGLSVEITDRLARAEHAVDGVDYCLLGYKAGYEAVVLSFGRDIRLAYPNDYYNVPLDRVPMMKHVRSYRDVAVVVTLASASYPEVWIPYGHDRFGVKIAAGVTAVMAPEYYPYLETGQLIGLLGGLKGAAEYEELIGRPGNGAKGMDAQTMTHLLIVAFIMLGNIAYFITLQRKKKEWRST